MAKISGPLCSQTAQGNYGKGAIQFRLGLGGAHAYKPLSPAKQNQALATQAQNAQRLKFQAVRDAWKLLTLEQKADYKIEARKLGTLSGWNLYISLNINHPMWPIEALLSSEGTPFYTQLNQTLLID